ncbi:MAG TPA: disulfide bond formation protein B [Gemmatimonadales bacterium]
MQQTASGAPGARQHGSLFTLLALAVLFLLVVPVGMATFWLGFARGDSPCVMCWEQRIGLILISLTGLFVLRYGPKPKYLGMAVLIAGWGLFMALRHVGMHAARDIGQGFSVEILGAHTYTWALLAYWVCVLVMGAMLLMVGSEHVPAVPRTLRGVERLAGGAFLVVVGANLVQAFASTGPPPFMGQSDPIRFSFNPRHWHWSLEEWKPLPISLRGRWAVRKPDLQTLVSDPAAGPLVNLPRLAVKERRPLTLPLDGPPTDLAWDPATDQFLLTTARGVYLTDSTLGHINRHTIVDPGYSVDLGRFAGAAFLDEGTLIAVGENKSYVVLRPNDQADGDANFRFFLESRDRFDEVTRGRFGTVRARLFYVMSAAYDPARNAVYTLTVPNNRARRLVISRFDRRDLTLSEEYSPALAPESGLALAPERTLDELVITGAAVAEGKLFAISAVDGTLLTIDLAGRHVVAAHAVAGLTRPTGVAIRGGDLYLVDDAGTVTVVARP